MLRQPAKELVGLVVHHKAGVGVADRLALLYRSA
jgi:hypothetical protein